MLRQRSDLLPGHLSILEQQERRNAANVIGLCDRRIALDIELHDLDLARELLGEFLEDGAALRRARPAPLAQKSTSTGSSAFLLGFKHPERTQL